jgi:endonuclease YncB( thermonuclease family)
VETYWHVGDALLAHISAQPRADYGDEIVPKLSKDMGLSKSLLYDILLFRRRLPILHGRGQLLWGHYRRLAHLPSQSQFRFYEKLAEQHRWSAAQLEEAIRADRHAQATTQPLAVAPDEDPNQGGPALRARFGELYTYTVVASNDPGSERRYLDLGFGMAHAVPLTGLSDPRPGQIVRSHRRADGTYTFEPLPPRTLRYTYVAWVDRVIDGDTFVGSADPGLGHQTWNGLRFRLRGIDCPELSTLAGRNARQFVEASLAPVGFVVIRTYRTDSFGRYLVDLRYLPGEDDPDVVRREGIFLNRQLLQERLARRYVR